MHHGVGKGRVKASALETAAACKALRTTSALRALVRNNDLPTVAAATQASASEVAGALWSELRQLGASSIHIDSPSAFARNQLRHGRFCEKSSLTGVCFQSTPSIACGTEHGGDWGWLVYGMMGFAACVHRGQLMPRDWLDALQNGLFSRFNSGSAILRECFPTATISVLRSNRRQADVMRCIRRQVAHPAVQAVARYLELGVRGVKRPGDPLYDQADSLVAALGALPLVAEGFREVMHWPARTERWQGSLGDREREGAFAVVC